MVAPAVLAGLAVSALLAVLWPVAIFLVCGPRMTLAGRNILVGAGVFFVGTGGKFDQRSGQELPVGGFVSIPPDHPTAWPCLVAAHANSRLTGAAVRAMPPWHGACFAPLQPPPVAALWERRG